MIDERIPDAEIWALFNAACDDALTDDQATRLEAALGGDERLRDLYLDYFRLHAELSRSARLERAREKIAREIRRPKPSPAVPPIILDQHPTPHSPLSFRIVSRISG